MQTRLTLAFLLAALSAALPAVTLRAAAGSTPVPPDSRRPLIESLDQLAARQTAARREVIARIHTRAEAQRRQAEVRAKMLELLGPLPAKTPLHPQITGTVPLDGFHIEKLTYESQPGFHVTALLYLPDHPKTRLPAIVVAPGHGASGKAGDYAFASTFARNGFAVLSYDPLGQGERLQYPDAANPSKTLSKGPTGEHGEAGLQPVLLGESVARYMLWDGIRAFDYLQSRPEIDPARIGAFGCSGGGAMTALLGALDPRIAATGTACYITSFDALLPSVGPQDGEQSTPGWIAAGLDFPDWIELAAPRPYAVISTASDMFPYAGARSSVAEARRFYALFDPASAGTPTGAPAPGVPTGPTLNPDTPNAVPPTARLQFLTGIGGHGNLRPIQSQIVAFFLRHLANSDAAPNLPPPPPPGASPFALPADLPKDAFQVTRTGQVATSFPGAETVFSLNLKHARQLPPPPRPAPLPALQAQVRAVTHAEATPGASSTQDFQAAPAKGPGQIDFDGHYDALTQWRGRGGDDWFSAQLAVPNAPGRHPAVLLLLPDQHASPQPQVLPQELFQLGAHGSVALAYHPLPYDAGTEELKSPLLGTFYLLGLRAELTGKTLLGLRVDEAIRTLDYLASRPDVDPANITAEASGHEALVLLHAAVLDPRLKHITLHRLPPSYRDLLANPMPTDAPQDILPGVLLHYDTPDLLRALGPRVTLAP